MRYGVTMARRGWLEASDVINTLRLKEFQQLLGR
jgi:DNA polymerase (family 10)